MKTLTTDGTDNTDGNRERTTELPGVLQAVVRRWRADAERYYAQVEEARGKGTPYDQMLATATTLKACAKELEAALGGQETINGEDLTNLLDEHRRMVVALRRISDDGEHHIGGDGVDLDQDPECFCNRCVAVRALDSPLMESARGLAQSKTLRDDHGSTQ